MTIEQLKGSPVAAPAPSHRSTDAHGRNIPLTKEENQKRIERGLKALDEEPSRIAW